MTKAAAKRETTTTALNDIERSAIVLGARQQFVSTALNMGWQLAVTVLVPVFIGVKLDDRYNSTPSYTLAAFILAIGCAVWVVGNTMKQVAVKQDKTKEKKS